MLRKPVICLFVILAQSLNSQDLHFSQIDENPSLLNPALIGLNHPIRFSVSNRSQWNSFTNAFRTYGASFETRFKTDEWQQVDEFQTMTFKKQSLKRFAGGLSIYSDYAGDGKLGLIQMNMSFASSILLNKENAISIGIQGSLNQKKVNVSQLIFPNQFNGQIYDPNLNSNEVFSEVRVIYPDVAFGLNWNYENPKAKSTIDKILKISSGFSVYHLIKPNQNFYMINTQVYERFNFNNHILASLPNKNYAIESTLFLQFQGSSREILIGGLIRKYINTGSKYTGIIKRNCIGYGLYYRHLDAIAAAFLLEWQEQYNLKFSYDFNFSKLYAISKSRGGFELSFCIHTPQAYLFQKKKLKQIENKK